MFNVINVFAKRFVNMLIKFCNNNKRQKFRKAFINNLKIINIILTI